MPTKVAARTAPDPKSEQQSTRASTLAARRPKHPRDFYESVARRPDGREILSRLAK